MAEDVAGLHSTDPAFVKKEKPVRSPRGTLIDPQMADIALRICQ